MYNPKATAPPLPHTLRTITTPIEHASYLAGLLSDCKTFMHCKKVRHTSHVIASYEARIHVQKFYTISK
jgi:hypothetical protein